MTLNVNRIKSSSNKPFIPQFRTFKKNYSIPKDNELTVKVIDSPFSTNNLQNADDLEFKFFNKEGEKVGSAILSLIKAGKGKLNFYPKSWFKNFQSPDSQGRYPLKPYVDLDFFAMGDQMRSSKRIIRDKKYGTMAMQWIVNMFKDICDSRIHVRAGYFGGKDFAPGEFYSKLGFELPEVTVDKLKKQTQQCINTIQEGLQRGLPNMEIKRLLKARDLSFPDTVDYKYYTKVGDYFLDNPERVLSYSLTK